MIIAYIAILNLYIFYKALIAFDWVKNHLIPFLWLFFQTTIFNFISFLDIFMIWRRWKDKLKLLSILFVSFFTCIYKLFRFLVLNLYPWFLTKTNITIHLYFLHPFLKLQNFGYLPHWFLSLIVCKPKSHIIINCIFFAFQKLLFFDFLIILLYFLDVKFGRTVVKLFIFADVF